jgi:hypothetical protein
MANGNRFWIPLQTTLEDNNRLACAPAQFTGVYAPGGIIIPTPEVPGSNPFLPNGVGGTVKPPPAKITVTKSGTYAVGGICLFTANYKINGLVDKVEVKYPGEDTLKIPTEGVDGIFYFPGCQVTHFVDQKVKDVMTSDDGSWQICFAAIPDKTMTIYYYLDNTKDITPPWKPLETKTDKGMACADLVGYSAVYAPVGK